MGEKFIVQKIKKHKNNKFWWKTFKILKTKDGLKALNQLEEIKKTNEGEFRLIKLDTKI